MVCWQILQSPKLADFVNSVLFYFVVFVWLGFFLIQNYLYLSGTISAIIAYKCHSLYASAGGLQTTTLSLENKEEFRIFSKKD